MLVCVSLAVGSGTLALAGCHSTPFGTVLDAPGTPLIPGPVVRLTFNPGNDYWPTWTQDGQGILYAFTRQTSDSNRRCLGLIPVGGGSQTWTLCDDRIIMLDSVTSFPAFALGSDGRLLYTEASADTIRRNSLTSNNLWIADSAKPFARTLVAALGPTTWLADLAWTGPTTFIGLQESYTAEPIECVGPTCVFPIDSIWTGTGIVIGSVGSASLTAIPGTAGATGYAIADNGASIVFSVASDLSLHKVPIGGGAGTVLATLPSTSGRNQVLGLSCRATTCVAAVSPVIATGPGLGFAGGPSMLYAISTTTGSVQSIYSTSASLLATPMISPTAGGGIVAQFGGGLGHRSTAAFAPHSDLEYFTGLVP